MTRNVHFVERKRGLLSFNFQGSEITLKRNLFRTLIFLAFFTSFHDNVFLQSESAQSKEPITKQRGVFIQEILDSSV